MSMARYNPWETMQKKAARIKNEVMTHFAYHCMYNLCNDELYSQACRILKQKHLARDFCNLTRVMKEIGRKG